MLRLLSDEDFNGNVVAGVRRSYPEIDVVRAQDVGLSGQEDPDVLAWAAEQNRILLTNDKRTIPPSLCRKQAYWLCFIPLDPTCLPLVVPYPPAEPCPESLALLFSSRSCDSHIRGHHPTVTACFNVKHHDLHFITLITPPARQECSTRNPASTPWRPVLLH